MKEIFKDKNKRKGFLGTVTFHLLLLIVFALYGLTYQYPPPEQGILINFGTSNTGSGEVQPDKSGEVEEQVVEEATETPTEQIVEEEVVKEEVVTQKEESIAIPKESEEEKRKKIEAEEKKKKEEDFKKKIENVWNKNKNQGGSEGENEDKGDQGKIDGSKDATSHTGSADGGGVSFSLSGRSMLSVPKIIDNSQQEGKVVVDIIVDRQGNVIKASPGGRGSTTTSTHLFKKAKEAAMLTKFSPNPAGPAEQKGVMTFVFVLE